MKTKDRVNMLMGQGWRVYLKSDFSIPFVEIRYLLEDYYGNRIVETDELERFIFVRDKKLQERQ